MDKLKTLDWIALILTIIGGINWGLVGLLQFDLVATLCGDMVMCAKAIYSLVGLSAVYMAVWAFKCKSCKG